jgi:hypothetical protein
MKANKLTAILVIAVLLCSAAGIAFAANGEAVKSGTASFLIPGLGQYLNNEHESGKGQLKMAFFALTELGAILTTSIVGGVVGYPQIWAGIGIFIGNHVLSAVDAYRNAPDGPEVGMKGSGVR